MSNPFSTRFIKPGAVPFLLPEEHALAEDLARWRAQAWFGELVGPHGCGKSTYLAGLLALVADSEKRVESHVVHSYDRRNSQRSVLRAPLDARTLLVIDGFEQLSWWRRRNVIARCRTAGAGLLVTSHKSVGLPLIRSFVPDLAATQRVVRHLLGDDRTITADDVAAAFARCGGNVRETLFAMYDVYEGRTARSNRNQ